MKFDLHVPQLDRVSKQLDEVIRALRSVENKLGAVAKKQEETMADLTRLSDEVSENNDAIDSAVTLLEGLSQQLKDAVASDDPAAVQAIVDQLDAQTQRLADAVVANTPAEGGGGGEPPAPTQLPA